MKPRFLAVTFATLALVFAAGCQNVADRIKEKPEVFAKLDRVIQEKIKLGIVELGYSPDMVYLALGDPSEKRETIAEAGRSETWIYSTYFQRYDGTAFVGYARRVYYDAGTKSYRTFYEPAYSDVYRESKEDHIRIVFKEGKVAMIEQVKP